MGTLTFMTAKIGGHSLFNDENQQDSSTTPLLVNYEASLKPNLARWMAFYIFWVSLGAVKCIKNSTTPHL